MEESVAESRASAPPARGAKVRTAEPKGSSRLHPHPCYPFRYIAQAACGRLSLPSLLRDARQRLTLATFLIHSGENASQHDLTLQSPARDGSSWHNPRCSSSPERVGWHFRPGLKLAARRRETRRETSPRRPKGRPISPPDDSCPVG